MPICNVYKGLVYVHFLFVPFLSVPTLFLVCACVGISGIIWVYDFEIILLYNFCVGRRAGESMFLSKLFVERVLTNILVPLLIIFVPSSPYSDLYIMFS